MLIENLMRMDRKEENKIQLKSLLETYSIDEISGIFSEIDENIISLHNCSSEDFTNLNSDFKRFYKVANQISDNASALFNMIASEENDGLLADIETFYQSIYARSEQLDYHMEVASDIVLNILSRIRQSFFPLKNFKQNLTSLMFLDTNLKLDKTHDENIDAAPLISIAKTIKEQLALQEKFFAKLKRTIKEDNLADQDVYNGLSISQILDDLKGELDVYSKHYTDAKDMIPEIKNRTDATSENISLIITKLQYQDIIKQRMQHIQTTHKDLLNELQNFANTREENSLNEKAKYFIRIRDIAGLQAAQLIHTNKEYQNAIQQISGKFLEIGENMTIVSKQCAEYTSFDSEKKKVFFDSLKKHLSQAKDKIKQFCDFNRNFENYIETIKENLDKIIWIDKSIAQLMGDMENSIEPIRKVAEQSGTDQHHLEQQVLQLYSDVKSNADLMSKVVADISDYRDLLQEKVVFTMDAGDYYDSVHLPGKIESYVDELNKFEQQIMDKLQQNNELSKNMLAEIQDSVSKIKYYDYFENVILNIIDELNTINYNLKVDEEHMEDKEENLNYIKDYYTMNSEFVIHEQVAHGNESEMEDFDEEGGDLELF